VPNPKKNSVKSIRMELGRRALLYENYINLANASTGASAFSSPVRSIVPLG
jgi:hypothetical protein